MARMPRRSVLLFAAAIFFAVSVPASAGSLSVTRQGQVEYYASDRADAVSVSGNGDKVFVKDARGVRTSGSCDRVSPTKGSCPAGDIYVFLDSGNDSVEFAVSGVSAIVEGYSGNDVIRGTRRGDNLYGGGGKDKIVALGGSDLIRGDGWLPDNEESEEPNAGNRRDVIKGGRGRDGVLYNEEGHGATVIHLGGGKGEDRLAGIERASGTAGSDRITGNSGANYLDGQGGRDTIRGRGGDDLILAEEDTARAIACGAGADEIRVDRTTRPNRDCEHAHAGYLVPVRVATAYAVADGQVNFEVACPTEAESLPDDNYGDDPCKGNLHLVRATGGIAGKAKFEFERGESGTVAVPLSNSDIEALADGETFSVEANRGGAYNWGFSIPLAG